MRPLIVLAGPTACGKTATAVKLAQLVEGEVVSADSMQVYKGMDIGTAKPDWAEREGVPHHLIDVVAPDEPFSAARYQQLATAAIDDIHQRNRLPILTGGTGFYINGVVFGNTFEAIPKDESRRAALTALAAEKGNTYLHDLLARTDPASAAAIHPNNVKRVARALSFCEATGRLFSAHNTQQRQNNPKYTIMFLVLEMARTRLYTRINDRVTAMFDAGLENEVRTLLEQGYDTSLVSMQGLGYKETARYINGQCTLAQAREAIQTGTRHYAKRQLTWFTHRVPQARWLSMDDHTPETAAKQIRRQMWL